MHRSKLAGSQMKPVRSGFARECGYHSTLLTDDRIAGKPLPQGGVLAYTRN